MHKRKNGKILVQVGIVILVVFFLILVTMTGVVISGSEKSFLDAQNMSMSKTLRENIPGELSDTEEWYISQWELHPELPVEEITQEEYQAIGKALSSGTGGILDTGWVQEQSQEVYRYALKRQYSSYLEAVRGVLTAGQIDTIFLIDVKENDKAVILMECTPDDKAGRSLGTEIDFSLSEHSAVGKLITEGRQDTAFEKCDDFPAKGDNYVGYLPVYHNQKLRAVFGISYDWSAFRSSLRRNLRIPLLLGSLNLVLAEVIILLFLYFKAIQPVGKIYAGVGKYTKTKDSVAIAKELSAVRVNNELGVLADQIGDMALEIDRYTKQNIHLAQESERVVAELDFARRIQCGMLSEEFPDCPSYSLCASMTPARQVSGDFYDFFLIDENHLCVLIADVSDKGAPAALFMMASKILINYRALMGGSPGEILAAVNTQIEKDNKSNMFVTVWMGILNVDTGVLTCTNAGHECPVIRTRDGIFRVFRDRHGFVVGAMPQVKYRDYEVTLEPGDAIFVYTDGVPEASSAAGEMYGLARLEAALNRTAGQSPEGILRSIRADVDAFVDGASQFDDLTMLCLEYRGAGRG